MHPVEAQYSIQVSQRTADAWIDRCRQFKVRVGRISARKPVKDRGNVDERNVRGRGGVVDSLVDRIVERLNLACKLGRDVVVTQTATGHGLAVRFGYGAIEVGVVTLIIAGVLNDFDRSLKC